VIILIWLFLRKTSEHLKIMLIFIRERYQTWHHTSPAMHLANMRYIFDNVDRSSYVGFYFLVVDGLGDVLDGVHGLADFFAGFDEQGLLLGGAFYYEVGDLDASGHGAALFGHVLKLIKTTPPPSHPINIILTLQLNSIRRAMHAR
jgi:hypothetical protein